MIDSFSLVTQTEPTPLQQPEQTSFRTNTNDNGGDYSEFQVVDEEVPSLQARNMERPPPSVTTPPRQKSGFKRISAVFAFVGIIVAVTVGLILVNMNNNRIDGSTAESSQFQSWEQLYQFCTSHDEQYEKYRTLDQVVDKRLGSQVLHYRDRIKNNIQLSRIRGSCNPESMALHSLAIQAVQHDISYEDAPSFLERYYLVVFFFAMGGSKWNNYDQWLSISNYCTWYGLTCDEDKNTLMKLNMRNNNLSGSLAAVIFELTSLRSLDMSENSISGELPPFLKQLSNLEYLSFDNTHVTGTIPIEIGRLSQLQIFYLSSFHLTGTIPSEIGSMTRLQYFNLHSEKLEGTIPATLRRLTELQNLSLYGRSLRGPLSPDVWLLPQLTDIYVRGRSLEEIDLPNFEIKTSWKRIEIVDFGLRGTIPTSIGVLTNLETLTFRANSIQGSLPTELGLLTSLKALDFSSNQIGSTLPDSLHNLQQIEVLKLDRNHFTGTMPDIFTSMSNLSKFTVYVDATHLECATSITDCWSTNTLIGTFPVGLCRNEGDYVLPCHSAIFESCPIGCCRCS